MQPKIPFLRSQPSSQQPHNIQHLHGKIKLHNHIESSLSIAKATKRTECMHTEVNFFSQLHYVYSTMLWQQGAWSLWGRGACKNTIAVNYQLRSSWKVRNKDWSWNKKKTKKKKKKRICLLFTRLNWGTESTHYGICGHSLLPNWSHITSDPKGQQIAYYLHPSLSPVLHLHHNLQPAFKSTACHSAKITKLPQSGTPNMGAKEKKKNGTFHHWTPQQSWASHTVHLRGISGWQAQSARCKGWHILLASIRNVFWFQASLLHITAAVFKHFVWCIRGSFVCLGYDRGARGPWGVCQHWLLICWLQHKGTHSALKPATIKLVENQPTKWASSQFPKPVQQLELVSRLQLMQ